MDHPLPQVFGDADFQGPVSGFAIEIGARGWDQGFEGTEFPGTVDVALDDVAAERAAGGGRQFEIHLCAGLERAERSAVERFLGEVGMEIRRVDIERGEADTGDGEGIAFAEAVCDAGRLQR